MEGPHSSSSHLGFFPGWQKTLAVVVVVLVLRKVYGKSWRMHGVQSAARVHRLARELCWANLKSFQKAHRFEWHLCHVRPQRWDANANVDGWMLERRAVMGRGVDATNVGVIATAGPREKEVSWEWRSSKSVLNHP